MGTGTNQGIKASQHTKIERHGMFTNTETGFMMEFPNGWIISVQWGPGHYCHGRANYRDVNPFDGQHHEFESENAEIVVAHKDSDELYPLQPYDDVIGYMPTGIISEYIQWTAQLNSDYESVMAEAQAKAQAGVWPVDFTKAYLSNLRNSLTT